MLQYKLLKSHLGPVIIGSDEDFEALYEMIHDIDDRSPITSFVPDLFLGFAYEVRHARQGDRKTYSSTEHYPEIGPRIGFGINWPLLILYERIIRHSLAYIPHGPDYQSMAYGLEAVIDAAISEDFPRDRERILFAWKHFTPTSPTYMERVNSRAPAYGTWTKAQRAYHFADLLNSFDPMYGNPPSLYENVPNIIKLATLDAFEDHDRPEV